MKLKLSVLGWLLGVAMLTGAEVLPPEKLLPADTLMMLTVPDWDKTGAQYKDTPMTQFWHDPAMKPFADKFNENLKREFLDRMERRLDIKFSDFSGLVHGQFTVAITQNGWTGETNQLPGLVILMDARDKSDQLKKVLTDLKKKWIDGGKKLKTETIRDVEFTTLIITPADLAELGNSLPGSKQRDADDAKGEPIEVTIGQSGSLLLVGTAPKDFEKILARQAGGLVSSLAEEPSFEANQSAMFRDAMTYGWVNFKPLGDILKKKLEAEGAGPGNSNMPKPDKIFAAIGIDGLKTLAMSLSQTSDGAMVTLFVGLPENGRRGLVKAVLPEAKESGALPVVSADVAKYGRWRLNGQKLWASVEAFMNEVSPQMGALLQMGLESAGKDKDPNFDLKKQLIGNLGDDVVLMQKPPRSAKAADMNNPPVLYLIGATSPEQLIVGIKGLAALLPPGMGGMKDREFLGRKVYSITLPPMPGPDGKLEEKSFHFAAGGGYVAMGTDVPMLEEYLRGESHGKTLAETAGLGEAAQKVGGTSTGWFGYENQTEAFRILFEALKQDPKALQKMFPTTPFDTPGTGDKGVMSWFDYSLLPPFEKVSKYFYYSVSAGSTKSEGLYFKTYAPTPPALRK